MGRSLEREIVALAAHEPSAKRERALESAAAAGPDWEQVVEQASGHGIAPLLAAILRDAQWRTTVPDAQRKRLQATAAASALKNEALVVALTAVLGAFSNADVEPVVLKGPALASTLYPEVGLRPFSDLDLLCRSEQVAAADLALRSVGYAAVEQKPTEVDGFHVVYRKPRGGAMIELHSDLLQLGLPARCMGSLWERLVPFQLGATQAKMLGTEYMILHLCVHLHTHGYTRLIWVKDLDLLLRRDGPQVDWPLVHALARAEGTALSVRHALANVHALLETPLPDEALRRLKADPLGEAAHVVLWPQRRVLALRSKQRLRSLRFNRHTGLMGVLPSLVVMGRRREKVRLLLSRTPAVQAGGEIMQSQPSRNSAVTGQTPTRATLGPSAVAVDRDSSGTQARTPLDTDAIPAGGSPAEGIEV